MFVLMGDAHIPGRARVIPKAILEKIKELSPDEILWTGDFTARSVLESISSIAKVRACKGNMDFLDIPFQHIIKSSPKILLIHGDTVRPRGNQKKLVKLGKKYGCGIVVCGHTHEQSVFSSEGVTVINPGSCTGVGSGGGIMREPGFATLDLELEKIVLYSLKNGKFETVEKRLL